MDRNRYIFVLLAVCLAFASCGHPAGNGQGYGGGDNARISNLRKRLSLGLTLMKSKFAVADIGQYSDCSKIQSQAVCSIFQAMQPAERDFLVNDFIPQVSDQLVTQNTTTLLPINLTTTTLTFPYPNGTVQPVAGIAYLQPVKRIELNTYQVDIMDDPTRDELFAHENAHEVLFKGKTWTDNEVIDPAFAAYANTEGATRNAFNKFGSIMAGYLADHAGMVPRLYPDPNDGCTAIAVGTMLHLAPYLTTGQATTDMSAVLNTIYNTGDFTLLAWANADKGMVVPAVIVSNHDYTNAYEGGAELYVDSSSHWGGYAGTAAPLDTGVTMTSGWHLVGIKRVVATNQLTTYVDGAAGPVFSSLDGSSSTGPVDSPVPTSIGKTNTGVSFWKGWVGGIYLFTSALTDVEIKALYQCGVDGLKL